MRNKEKCETTHKKIQGGKNGRMDQLNKIYGTIPYRL